MQHWLKYIASNRTHETDIFVGVLPNVFQYYLVPPNTFQYYLVPPNAFQYYLTLLLREHVVIVIPYSPTQNTLILFISQCAVDFE